MVNWKNIDEILELVLIFLCYAVGIGSILFGSLSVTNYSYHFIIIGMLALILVIIHTYRRQLNIQKIQKIEEIKDMQRT